MGVGSRGEGGVVADWCREEEKKGGEPWGGCRGFGVVVIWKK